MSAFKKMRWYFLAIFALLYASSVINLKKIKDANFKNYGGGGAMMHGKRKGKVRSEPKARLSAFNSSLSQARQVSSRLYPRRPYPSLSSLINGRNITGDVGFLLDFVIAGFPKTGTTSLTKRFFDRHPEIAIPRQEVHILAEAERETEPPVEMIRLLHGLLPSETDDVERKRGYKAPREISNIHVLNWYAKYWPNAKLIVGVRHPLEWFHSFYNFKLRQFRKFNKTIAPPELLDGECLPDIPDPVERAKLLEGKLRNLNDRGVCADLANYHVRFSWLGKTNIANPAEEALLGSSRRHKLIDRAPLPNKIFLYDLSQLGDQNYTRLEIFLSDMQKFLGLQTPFALPRKSQKFLYEKNLFDICGEDKYEQLRKKLMKSAKDSSEWIRTYFMHHPDVTISNPDYFEETLKTWKGNPCNKKMSQKD